MGNQVGGGAKVYGAPLTPREKVKAHYGKCVVKYLKKWHNLAKATDWPVPIQGTNDVRVWTALHHNFKSRRTEPNEVAAWARWEAKAYGKTAKVLVATLPKVSEEEGELSEEMIASTHMLAKTHIRNPSRPVSDQLISSSGSPPPYVTSSTPLGAGAIEASAPMREEVMQGCVPDTPKGKHWYQSPGWSSMPPFKLLSTEDLPEVSWQDKRFLRTPVGMTTIQGVSMQQERIYPPLPPDSDDEEVITSKQGGTGRLLPVREQRAYN